MPRPSVHSVQCAVCLGTAQYTNVFGGNARKNVASNRDFGHDHCHTDPPSV